MLFAVKYFHMVPLFGSISPRMTFLHVLPGTSVYCSYRVGLSLVYCKTHFLYPSIVFEVGFFP